MPFTKTHKENCKEMFYVPSICFTVHKKQLSRASHVGYVYPPFKILFQLLLYRIIEIIKQEYQFNSNSLKLLTTNQILSVGNFTTLTVAKQDKVG
jgi:hypothetical protein